MAMSAYWQEEELLLGYNLPGGGWEVRGGQGRPGEIRGGQERPGEARGG